MSPSSAIPSSSSSTSRRPASTRRRAGTPGRSIRSLRELGKTILLTTHYLDEAQQLADRVAVLRDGEIVRIGRPSELTASAGVQIRYRRLGEEIVLETDEPTRALHELTGRALAEGFELEDLELRRATLEDVYLDLVSEESA